MMTRRVIPFGTGTALYGHVMTEPRLRGIHVRLTEQQLDKVRADAKRAGMTMQAWVEMTLSGEVRPRGPYGQRPYLKKQDEELPMTG